MVKCRVALIGLSATVVLVCVRGETAIGAERGHWPESFVAKPPSPPVFKRPSEDELAKIAHPSLRAIILTMAHQDQVARTSGK